MLVSASVLAADWTKLYDELHSIRETGVDYIHLDIMDGRFVPNITFGQFVSESLIKSCDVPCEAHLMIVEPWRYAGQFVEMGCRYTTVHVEAEGFERALSEIDKAGGKAGLALNPETPPERIEPYIDSISLVLVMSVNPGFAGQRFIEPTYDKVGRVAEMVPEETLICVDGGVNGANSPKLARSGANMLAVGSGFFKAEDRASFVGGLKALS